MCSESFWLQKTSNRHSWKYRRFHESRQGKHWHPWVAHVSSIHSIPGCLKSQKQLVCSSKSLWGTNVSFIKNVLPLTHLPWLPFLSIRLGEHCSHRRSHIQWSVHIQDRVGSYRISALHSTQPTASQASSPTEGGGECCQSLMSVILRGPFAYSLSWESASLLAWI